MKLLIVAAIKEYRQVVADILQKAGIRVFSVSETVGYKDDHKLSLLDEWFSSGDESFDSIFVFSFTNYDNAASALQMIKEYNSRDQNDFPIRAFIVPVEQTSYSL